LASWGHVHFAPLIRYCDGRIKKGGQGRKMEGRVSEKWDVEGEMWPPALYSAREVTVLLTALYKLTILH